MVKFYCDCCGGIILGKSYRVVILERGTRMAKTPDTKGNTYCKVCTERLEDYLAHKPQRELSGVAE